MPIIRVPSVHDLPMAIHQERALGLLHVAPVADLVDQQVSRLNVGPSGWRQRAGKSSRAGEDLSLVQKSLCRGAHRQPEFKTRTLRRQVIPLRDHAVLVRVKLSYSLGSIGNVLGPDHEVSVEVQHFHNATASNHARNVRWSAKVVLAQISVTVRVERAQHVGGGIDFCRRQYSVAVPVQRPEQRACLPAHLLQDGFGFGIGHVGLTVQSGPLCPQYASDATCRDIHFLHRDENFEYRDSATLDYTRCRAVRNRGR